MVMCPQILTNILYFRLCCGWEIDHPKMWTPRSKSSVETGIVAEKSQSSNNKTSHQLAQSTRSHLQLNCKTDHAGYHPTIQTLDLQKKKKCCSRVCLTAYKLKRLISHAPPHMNWKRFCGKKKKKSVNNNNFAHVYKKVTHQYLWFIFWSAY